MLGCSVDADIASVTMTGSLKTTDEISVSRVRTTLTNAMQRKWKIVWNQWRVWMAEDVNLFARRSKKWMNFTNAVLIYFEFFQLSSLIRLWFAISTDFESQKKKKMWLNSWAFVNFPNCASSGEISIKNNLTSHDDWKYDLKTMSKEEE